MYIIMCLMCLYIHLQNLSKETEGTGDIGPFWDMGIVAREQEGQRYFSLLILF